MSCIKAVAEANDAKLIQVHKLFKEWKKNNTHRKVSTDYGLAIRYFKKCVRYITKMCNTFGPNAHVTYARTMVTTQVIDGKVYWQSGDYLGWKQVRRDAPPLTKNGMPTKVFYNYNRDVIYRYLIVLHVHDDGVLANHTHPTLHFFVHVCRQRYKEFIRSGCQFEKGKIRYTGADNAKLKAPDRAKRFLKYLQVCCNLYRGKDYIYIKDTFFPSMKNRDKENVCMHACMSVILHYNACACV